jgi:hypothetical protein
MRARLFTHDAQFQDRDYGDSQSGLEQRVFDFYRPVAWTIQSEVTSAAPSARLEPVSHISADCNAAIAMPPVASAPANAFLSAIQYGPDIRSTRRRLVRHRHGAQRHPLAR